ncbi:T9SS type A sorting domain-containing protein [Taibaiella koreensis]|uniref:T9SS type A sorting domain-containing protein n=1 Tax=Taibaiella koreensis TaxID=1268548 RepID=UPI0013C36CCC|nr:T9SS type A sorting domain-containing protein [Taibaiella koreensis]
MANQNLLHWKTHFKQAMAAALLSSAGFGAFAQSYDWVIQPATRIQFSGGNGVASAMPTLGCLGTQTAQVISTSSGSDPAFAFVPNCGTYNLSGTSVAGKGYRNVFPIPGLCKKFYAVEWYLNHFPANSRLVLRKLDATNPAAVVETDSVDLFSEQSDDQHSNTVAIAPLRTDGTRLVYFYDAKNNALKSVTISATGGIGAVQHLRYITLGATVFETYNQMEVSPNGKYVIFSDRFGKVWSVDVFTAGYPVAELTAGIPIGTGRHIHGYEYVPMTNSPDRVYISWHGSGPTAGGVDYVEISNPATPISLFSTITLPVTTSQLSWGYTEIERGRDGQLYLATNPNTGLGDNSMTTGPLYVVNITNSTIQPAKINNTTQVYINTFSNGAGLGTGFGYKIQAQIDGESFSRYNSLSPSYTLNGISQSSPSIIPQVVLCDNTPLTLHFNTGGYITSAGITLQKGTVNGNTFTAVGLPIAVQGNPLGAPAMEGDVNVGSLFGLGSYTGGVRFTLTFTNSCGTTATITQTFDIARVGLVVDFKLQGPSGCPALNRVTSIGQLANSNPYTQPATSVFCKDGWLGALSAGIQQASYVITGNLTIQDYTLSVQQVDNAGNAIGAPIATATQTTPFNNYLFNSLNPSLWFYLNYNTIKNNAYFKVTLAANTTPCGIIERYSYFRIIDGNAPGNTWRSTASNPFTGDADATDIQVFPNPATEQIHFSWQAGNAENDARIQLTDVLGKTVLQQSQVQQQGSNEAILDVSRLAPGMYYYQLESGGMVYKGKISRL